MGFSSAVLSVGQVQWKHRKFGLIGDRLCIQIMVGGNGKNFIIVSVVAVGGLGAAIAHPLSMLVVRQMIMT